MEFAAATRSDLTRPSFSGCTCSCLPSAVFSTSRSLIVPSVLAFNATAADDASFDGDRRLVSAEIVAAPNAQSAGGTHRSSKPLAGSSWSNQSKPIAFMMRLLMTTTRASLSEVLKRLWAQ